MNPNKQFTDMLKELATKRKITARVIAKVMKKHTQPQQKHKEKQQTKL